MFLTFKIGGFLIVLLGYMTIPFFCFDCCHVEKKTKKKFDYW